MAVPNRLGQLPKDRLRGAVRQVIGEWLAARMKAVSQHRRVQLFFAHDHQDNVCNDANGIPRSMIAKALRG